MRTHGALSPLRGVWLGLLRFRESIANRVQLAPDLAHGGPFFVTRVNG